MSDVVIRVEGLGKKFKIGTSEPYYRLSEAMVGLARNAARLPGRMMSRPKAAIPEEASRATKNGEFWALKDINFEVKRGDVVGIIGRNGAGKSTLLKILSRITEPTEGRFGIKGQVASLLEVGTGFHPELTGRENIYLSGNVLGMSKADIRRKFDEIVEFAGTEQFLDTPVKRYSSGMQVRLGFAIAAHLEPEILIVDEVLAVGDAEFQKKCLGKMGEVSKSGRTVLFVSHNMAAVRSLCSHSVVLQHGTLAAVDTAENSVSSYLLRHRVLEDLCDLNSCIDRLPKNEHFRLERISILQNDHPTTTLLASEPIHIQFEYELCIFQKALRIYFDLVDEFGDLLIRSFHDEHHDAVSSMRPGTYRSNAVIPAYLLAPRTYTFVFRATVYNGQTLIPTELSIPITVEKSGINRAYPEDPVRSRFQPYIEWQTYQHEEALHAD